MKTLPEHPLLSQVRGQSPVKRSRGERGCEIAPFPGTEAIKTNRNEGQGGETGTDVSLAAKVQLGSKKKSKKRKKKKKRQKEENYQIFICAPWGHLVLWGHQMEWRSEKKKRNNKPWRNQ